MVRRGSNELRRMQVSHFRPRHLKLTFGSFHPWNYDGLVLRILGYLLADFLIWIEAGAGQTTFALCRRRFAWSQRGPGWVASSAPTSRRRYLFSDPGRSLRAFLILAKFPYVLSAGELLARFTSEIRSFERYLACLLIWKYEFFIIDGPAYSTTASHDHNHSQTGQPPHLATLGCSTQHLESVFPAF